MKKLLLILIPILLLSSCVHTRHRSSEAKAYVQAQADLIKERKPLFELRAQPGETITLSGVEAIVVNDPREVSIKPLPSPGNPWLNGFLRLAELAGQAYGHRVQADQLVDVANAVGNVALNVPRADNSTTYNVGGNLGDTDQSVTTPITYGDGAVTGDGNVVGDANGDGDRAGNDLIVGDQNQNSGRIDSDDIDNSNPGDEGNVITHPPADPDGDG